ncbi:unnamed protein product [Effrenium voratum]|nr:unnamed protein product [Effrenium voratum]
MEGVQIRALIGKGGETIKEIRLRSGADIKIDHLPSDPEGNVTIVGEVEKTEAMIKETLAAKGCPLNAKSMPPPPAPVPLPGEGVPPLPLEPNENEVIVPADLVGLLIGPSGTSIREIREKAGGGVPGLQPSEDSEEIEERVGALIGLLKGKDDAKIKACGEKIANDAWDNEAWFEPEQMSDMLHTWLDACIAGRDDEVLDVTAKALQFSKVEDGSVHPKLPEIFQKVTKALHKPGAKHMEYMFNLRVQPMKFTGDPKLYPVLAECLEHEKADIIHDGLDLICSMAFMHMYDGIPDEEAAAIFKDLVVPHAKFLLSLLPKYKPGDMEMSKRLANKLSYARNLFQAAFLFCTHLALRPKDFPKASAAIAVPTLVMELQEKVASLKPKPKEQDLKEQLKMFAEGCTQLLSQMPKPAAGSSTDPLKDAQQYLKALGTVSDSDSLNGILKMMMSSTDPKVLDLVFQKSSMDTLFKALERVKRDDTSEVNRTFSALFVFAAEHRPKLVDAVGDRMLDVYMSINPAWNNPRIFVDALLTHCPSTAAKLWTKMPLWMKAIHSAKGSAMMDGVLYQVLHAIEGLPKVLEGKELEEFCKKNIEIANLGKGTTMEDSVKSSAVVAMRGVVSKDKARISKEVLDWVQVLKQGEGYTKSAAEAFMDLYEGRSLEGAYEQINQLNLNFKEACGDMESLKKYVDDNVSDLKDFIASVAKKLPMPVKFTSEEKYLVKKAILLHFECQAPIPSRYCALPQKATYTTETQEWARWLKMGLSAAKLGKSVLSAEAITDLPGVVDQVKGLYSMYKKDDGEDFLTFISEPFLTSSEQDKLLNQLRAAAFFEKFCYDNQSATWLCANCHAIYLKAGANRSQAALEAAASEVQLPIPSCRMDGPAASLQDRAQDTAGAVLEVKKTTMACCDLFGFNICAPSEEEIEVK